MTKPPIKHKKSPIDEGDGELWQHVAVSVKPLRDSLKNRMPEVEVSPVLQKTGEQRAINREAILVCPGGLLRSTSLPELSHGAQTGLDKSNAKKLRKGQHTIEGQLDLHGMNQEQAHLALNLFIEVSYGARKRCVLVITGKGLKRNGSVGVMRMAAPRWLNENPNRSRVLAFSYATQKDGGEGALYVMLKKNR
jgi:DNA-nicking Smr family endonuclease